MDRILRPVFVALSLLLCTESFAQYVPEWHQGDLNRKGTRIAVLDEKLDRETTLLLVESVGGPEMLANWQKYAKERGWGIGLTSGGYTLAVAGFCYGGVYMLAGVVGTIFAAIGGQEAVDKLWADMGPRVTIGASAMLAGLVVGTTGVVLLSRGNRKLKGIVSDCNAAGLPSVEAQDVSLTFGPTPSGVGLAFHF
ncbi:MAG: hypothetical protein II874_00725 [Bacteroidales bacterium]|nr:hypothetical protein [Bacteroidales bacterium]